MKLAIRYYLYNVRNSLLIAFGVVTGILLSSGLFLHFNQKENTDYSISGFEITCIIFTLVTGLVAFREYFRFFQQNGISRKSQFVGWTTALTALCAGEAAICLLAGRVFMPVFTLRKYVFADLRRRVLLSKPGILCRTGIFLDLRHLPDDGQRRICHHPCCITASPKLANCWFPFWCPAPCSSCCLWPISPLLHGGYTWLLKQIMILATGHTETGVFLWIPITTALVCSVLCLLAAWGMMRRAEVK